MSYEYEDGLDTQSRARYFVKLSVIGTVCPYKIEAEAWINDPTKWPELEWPEVFDYLVNTPGVFTRESMSNRKALEAFDYFQSGFVHTVLFHKPSPRVMLLKTDVMPSQHLNDEPHHPWVAVDMACCVVTAAHCTCMAGLGESCSHIAALLFKIEAAVRLGYNKTTCTDVPCAWNHDFVKKVRAKPLSEIQFYQPAGVTRAAKRLRASKLTPATAEEQALLLGKLARLEAPPIGVSLFKDYATAYVHKAPVPTRPKVPESLRGLYQASNKSLSQEQLAVKKEGALGHMLISREQIALINSATKGQSTSTLWHELREGRITSSVAHRILQAQGECTPALLKCITAPRKHASSRVPSLRWGLDHEEDALRLYQEYLLKSHTDSTLERTGLTLSCSRPFIGASADGVVSCLCHGRRVVEVKCPYTLRHVKDQEELLNAKAFYLVDGDLKQDHQYFTQVQLSMYCNEVDVCDFVVWTPQVMLVVEVLRDHCFLQRVIPRLESFFKTHILPELLTRNSEHTQTPACNDAPLHASAELFCVCRRVDNGEKMIGCDSPKCTIKWFHLKCTGLKRVPKGKWLCKACKKK